MAESARIRRIKVTKLFGIFDHEIVLNLRERITILHGPNGYGKTIILQMLQGLFSSRWDRLGTTPFDEFEVEFEDGDIIRVKQEKKSSKAEKGGAGDSSRVLVFTFVGKSEPDPQTFRYEKPDALLEVAAYKVERLIPEFIRTGPDEWINRYSGQPLTLIELMDRFPETFSSDPILRTIGSGVNEPGWMKLTRERIRLYLIHTQRLSVIGEYRSGRRPIHEPAVEKYSEEIAGDFKAILTTYASQSQERDSSFLDRLFQQSQEALLPLEELQERLNKLEAKRAQLTALGFLDPERDRHKPPQKLDDPTKLDVLSVYVHDTESKLAVFDEMAKKVQFLTDAINKRFKYKHMSVSKDKGFIFRSIIDDSPLPLGSLSSGEQHELVLFYELLFKVTPNALVLIDEPELSLHLAWQQQFLGDLLEIVKLSGVDVLVATHSPAIIGKRWDLTVELKGPDLGDATRS